MPEHAFLKGSNIYLRSLEDKDAYGNYANWFNQAEICAGNSHHIFPYLIENALDYINRIRNAKDSLVLAIISTKNDEHIGNISLGDINWIYRTAEFGIILGEKAYWNRGFSKEAARLLINHGFLAMNLNRISCGTFENNLGMHKLAESLGFQKEGIRRAAAYKNNEYLDIIEYGLLKQEWRGSHE